MGADLKPKCLEASHSKDRDERRHCWLDRGQDVHEMLAPPRMAEGDGRLISYVNVKQILNIFL
jgi:hypothetical protein